MSMTRLPDSKAPPLIGMRNRRHHGQKRRRHSTSCFSLFTTCSSASQGHDLADLNDDEAAGDDDVLLVHPNVPSATSEKLGVPTLMSRMLEAEELDFR